MTKMILLMILVFVGLPALAFLIMKFGTAGFYRGKEESRKRKFEFDDNNELN